MHPDLYDVLYRQRERELEQRLARALVVRERAASPGRRRGASTADRWRTFAGRWASRVGAARDALTGAHPRPAAECCPAAAC